MSSEAALLHLDGSTTRHGAGTTATGATRSVARSGVPGGGEAAALGNNADLVSIDLLERVVGPRPVTPSADVHAVLPPPGAVRCWHQRSVGRELMQQYFDEMGRAMPRMRWCGYRIERGGGGVHVYARPEAAYGRLAGVCVCGQSLACPVCAPRIAARRGVEVAEAYSRAVALGWEARLETHTFPHVLDTSDDALLRLLDRFSEIWRHYQNHACRRQGKAHRGHHVAIEITFGEHGWHPHRHRLRYDMPGVFSPERERAAWLATLEVFGLRTRGADAHSYDCEPVRSDVGARYVAKLATAVEAQSRALGAEITGAHNKGKNLNTLLAAYIAGDELAGRTWSQGVASITARKVSSVRWSRGLAARLGIDREPKSDAELAREEVLPSDVLLGVLSPGQWIGVVRNQAEFALLCAANRGRCAVDNMLRGLGLGPLNGLPEETE